MQYATKTNTVDVKNRSRKLHFIICKAMDTHEKSVIH